MTKPGDFFVGVVDLFSILLPGAILAYLSANFITADSHGLMPIVRGTTEGWIAFVLAAYVFGHFLNAVGGFAEELLDPVKWWEKKLKKMREMKLLKNLIMSRAETGSPPMGALDETAAQQFASARMCEKLRKFPAVKDLSPDCGGAEEARLVRRMIKSSLRVQCPVATAELDRLEAVSKFFRSLTLVMLIFFVRLFYFHYSKDFPTWRSASAVLLIVLVSLFGSLALYIYQAGRRQRYTYIYFLVHELGSKGEGPGDT